MQRILNESELKSMPEWVLKKYSWWKNGTYTEIAEAMIGKPVKWCEEQEYIVEDYMIAKEPKESIFDMLPKYESGEFIKIKNNMETKKVTLNNGTVLEVGKKYRLKEWDIDEYVDILYISDKLFFCKDNFKNEYSREINWNWLPYTPPTPQKEWKTFLIERGQRANNGRVIVQFQSIEDAKSHYPHATSITEVKINIEPINS